MSGAVNCPATGPVAGDVLTQSSVIRTQYPHVGIAQAVAHRGDDAVVAVYGVRARHLRATGTRR